MLAMAPVAGKIFDSYGPRVPLLAGSVAHVFGLMMTSLCKEYYQFFLSQSVVSGIGASFIFTPALSAVRPSSPPLLILQISKSNWI
jgi:MFS family permease